MSTPSLGNARVFDSAMAYEVPAYDGTTKYHISPRHVGKFFKGLLVTTAGNVTIMGCDGNEVTFAVPAGLHLLAGMKLQQPASGAAVISAVLY
jgi:hypothetical protein